MLTMEIVDFRTAPAGLLVKRSAHCLDQQAGANPEQLGMIVGLDFFEDATGKAICWPEIHWEGQAISRTTHPANVTPFRAHILPTIQMSQG